MIFLYVYVHGNPPPLCLPANPGDKWADFKEVIRNMYKVNPDQVEMTHFDEPFQPQDDKTLAELGIRQKSLLKIKA
ncbi:MAG TPA: hypothetical protein DDY49_01340 [Paenibacillaceae bacterium]|nr:hypothetical protein [Paenibacillaceae bacterium]